ncbi:MAG: PilZ domain-containing protein, partial [Betaproteobacteria bacterium]
MRTQELRTEKRIRVSEKGVLSTGSVNSGDAWFPCVVKDLSDSGLRVVCNKQLSIGQTLELRCELFPEKSLNCKIEVKNIGLAGVGTKVTEIDRRGTGLIQLYLQEQY